MFRSIRWRLIVSYVLLTLITVGVMGVLALSLVGRYVDQQEKDYLTANAQAVARQAQPFMWPAMYPYQLQELASTSSLLGGVRVRILDTRQQVLADSGPSVEAQEYLWIVPSSGVSAESLDSSVVMMLPENGHLMVPVSRDGQFSYEQLPPDVSYIVVHRQETVWGSRLVFEVKQGQPPADTATESAGATPRSQRVVNVPIGDAQNPLGYVELSDASGFGSEALTTTRSAFGLAGIGAALLAVIVGLLVSQRLTAPLRSLTAAAGQMSGSDLSARAPVSGQDEFGQLAGQFNQMAERLEDSFAKLSAERDALRRFIADASHELRTPITALKTFNELLRGAASDDPAARAEFLAESQVQLDRLEWITHNLLDLSRLDAGLVNLDMADCEVSELVEAVAATFKPLASDKGITLSVKQPDHAVHVRCDRARIELALSNLVDNAVKFTPAGGQVEIGAERVGEESGASPRTVQLWVQDAGAGIDPEDLPHIFERFYRGKNNHAARGEGSGLGLAIVQSIVQAHGGRVFVDSQPASGSRFVIELCPHTFPPPPSGGGLGRGSI